MIKQLAMLLAAGCLGLGAQASSFDTQAKAYAERYKSNPMRYARQLQDASAFKLEASSQVRGKRVAPYFTLPTSDSYSFLEGPNGEVWMCTYDYDSEKVQHEFYTETVLKGITVTVYNANFEKVGVVKDSYPLAEGQTAIAQISIDPVLTQKFFNVDASYEIAIMVAYNTPSYKVDARTYVYSIDAPANEEGNTPRLSEHEGYIVASVNTSNNPWSEDYYISFLTEGEPDDSATDFSEFVASQKYIAKTYKKAGWNSEPQVIGEIALSVANLPGDMMTCPFLLATKANGTATFIVQQYEKWFFNNAVGPTGDNTDSNEGMPTEDNNLLVDVYTFNSWSDKEWKLDHTTKIPCVQTDENPDVLFRFYGIGNLTYANDYRPDGSLRLSVDKYLISNDDSYLQSYYLYDKDGKEVSTIAENAYSFLLMSDIVGQESQVMFIDLDSPEAVAQEAEAEFYFVDLESCERVLSITNKVDKFTLRANVDRVPYGNSYRYAFETNQAEIDDDLNINEQILWLEADGSVARVDKVNLGQHVAIAQVYLDQSVLNPYLFDTDDSQEYLWLVKRYQNLTSSKTTTELMLVSANGSSLLQLTPDTEKGELRSISVLHYDTDKPVLWIAYYNSEQEDFHQDLYSLPFNTLKGAGTEADPYQIATAGDLAQMGRYPSAHFVLTDDIDASQIIFNTLPVDFSGKLDGQSNAINNLNVSGSGSLFNYLSQGAEIKNLYFNNVRILESASSTGLLANTASGATISNVHIMGLNAHLGGSPTFGSLLGGAYNFTNLTNVSVSAANISIPQGSDVGGIVGDMRTGSKVSTAAFAGAITAASYLGGIAGSINSDNVLTDCHVDADLKAMTVVGGIAGYMTSGLISRCYVEGSIEATGNPEARFDHGPCVGGILGEMCADGSAVSSTNPDPTVKDNLVNLTSIKGYTSTVQDNTTASMHRIVGRTIFNEPADEKGKAWPADNRFANNFAVATLPVVDSSVEAAGNTTEGASVDVPELSQDWFKDTLGFEYGETSPWNESTEADPALNIEQFNVCVPAKVTVAANTTFELRVILAGRELYTEDSAMSQFSYECDEQYLAPTGVFSLNDNVLSVQFESYKEGEVPVTLCGAKCMVTITKNLSTSDSVVSDNVVNITLSGNAVIAPGQHIAVYSLQGIEVAAGHASVSVASLAKGIYVAVANGASLKFAVK